MSTLEERLQEELMSELTQKKHATSTPTPETVMFEEEQDDAPKGNFKAVTGFKAPSGIDHVITCYKPEEFPESMREHIPSMDEFEDYEPQKKEIEALLVAWEMGDNTNIVGATGSGKSSMVKFCCAMTQRPFIRLNGRGDMESSSLLGQLTARDGSTEWVDGTVTEAVRNGAVLCMDEWTLIPPEIMMSLQWLMEDNGALYLTDMPSDSSSKLVQPHEHFRLVCTDNTRGLGDESGSFAATNVQNTATLDRFGTIIHVGYLDKKHEKNILKNKYKDLTDDLADKMLQFAKLVRTSYDQGELSLTCSPRTLLNWARKSLYYRSPKLALRLAFYEKISGDAERTAVQGFYKTVFNESL